MNWLVLNMNFNPTEMKFDEQLLSQPNKANLHQKQFGVPF